jgi:hypothetical protein
VVEPERFACIVGAPRCGTTSLARYLKEHPGVRFSRIKEPHFFSRLDLNGHSDEALRSIVERDYLARYFKPPTNGEMLAEASVSYLYAADHMRPVLRLWPEARFIIAVRNPLDMLPSVHRRLLYTGDETVRDFEEAWALMDERRRGRRVPPNCVDPRLLDYQEVGSLGKHAARFVETVGAERCLFVVFDDFAGDSAGQYRRVLEFLDLPDDGRTAFGVHRPSKQSRIGWLQRALKRPPHVVRAHLADPRGRVQFTSDGPKLPPRVRKLVRRGRKRLLRLNAAPAEPSELPERIRREMCDTFADDVALLGRLVGRNLSRWLETSTPSEMSGPRRR